MSRLRSLQQDVAAAGKLNAAAEKGKVLPGTGADALEAASQVRSLMSEFQTMASKELSATRATDVQLLQGKVCATAVAVAREILVLGQEAFRRASQGLADKDKDAAVWPPRFLRSLAACRVPPSPWPFVRRLLATLCSLSLSAGLKQVFVQSPFVPD